MTTLNDQLQKLAIAAGYTTKKTRGKPSLIHTFQEAADIGLEDIHEVAIQGFEKLCRLDLRFQAFSKSLFGRSTLTFDRDQQTAEANAKLDAAIASFCRLLTPYFLAPAAFQALEYLIRRFKVNELNVGDLMTCALPYHFTQEFVRLVYVLHLERTPFEFLTPMQKSGAALPREALVHRCITDKSLFRFVCDMAEELASPRIGARSAMPFYAATICEIITTVPQLDESILAMLMPYLLAGLGQDVVVDYRSATYMILTQLAARVTMTEDLVGALTTSLCRTLGPAGLPQGLLVLSHLAITQPHMKSFPEKGFKHLAKLPGLAQELISLSQKPVKFQPLLSLLIDAMIEHVYTHAVYVKLLEDVIRGVPLLGSVASSLAMKLLKLVLDGGDGKKKDSSEAVLGLLKALGTKYPSQLDESVSLLLAELAPSSDAKGGDKHEVAKQKQRQHFLAMLQEIFIGTSHAPIAEANTTLALALDSSNPSIRQLALENLNAGDGSEEDAALHAVILRRILDEDLSVAGAALELKCLKNINSTALLDTIERCLASAVAVARSETSGKHKRGVARGVARKAVKLLSGELTKSNPKLVNRVVNTLIGHALATQSTVKLTIKIIRAIAAFKDDHPLSAAFSKIDVDSIEAEVNSKEPLSPPSSKKKGSSKATAGSAARHTEPYDYAAGARKLNTAIITILGTQAATDKSSWKAVRALAFERKFDARAIALIASRVSLANNKAGVDVAQDVLNHFVNNNDAASSYFISTNEEAYKVVVEGLIDVSTPTEDFLDAVVENRVRPDDIYAGLLFGCIQKLTEKSVQDFFNHQGMEKLFVKLASSTGNSKSAILSAHLHEVVSKTQPICSSAVFLSDIFGRETKAQSLPVQAQVAALTVLAALIAAAPKTNSKSPKSAASKPSSLGINEDLILRVLSALSHPEDGIRTAALELVNVLQTSNDDVLSLLGLDISTTKSLLASLTQYAALIAKDMEAVEWMLSQAVSSENATATAPSQRATKRSASAGGSRKKRTASEQAAIEAAQFSFSPSEIDNICAFFLQQFAHQHSEAGIVTAQFLLRVLPSYAPAQELMLAGLGLLRTITTTTTTSSSSAHQELAADLLALCTSTAVADVDSKACEEVAETLLTFIEAKVPGASEPSTSGARARYEALVAISPQLYSGLPDELQRRLFLALTHCASSDSDDSCRSAAHTSLESLPVAAETLIPLLLTSASASQGNTSSKSSASKRQRTSTDSGIAASGGAALSSSFMPTVEVLQWKENISDSLSLVEPLQTALQLLLDQHSFANEQEAAGDKPTDEARGDDDEGVLAEGTDVLTSTGYAMQLTLTVVQALANTHASSTAMAGSGKASKKATAVDSPFDLKLALKCAQQAPDGAVRNAALSLVGSLARAAPTAALDVTLDVVALVGESASLTRDAHSNEIAAATLAAVVPAWVESGNPLNTLISAVADALPSMHSVRRLNVMSALVRCLPEESGLSGCLLVLLQKHASASSAAAAGTSSEDGEDWWSDLAGSVVQQATVPERVQAFATLLIQALEAANNDVTAPLPLLATAFTTQQLSKLAVSPMLSDDATQKHALLQGCERVMQGALLVLQELGANTAKKPPAVTTAVTTATYSLLEALQKVMAPAAFISGLMAVTENGNDRIRRRTLNLLSTRLRKDLAESVAFDSEMVVALEATIAPAAQLLSLSDDSQDASGGSAQKKAGRKKPSNNKQASAAMEATSDYTRQSALALLGLLAQAIGSTRPQKFLAVLPTILELTVPQQVPAVRASALACVSAIVVALGAKLVPLLPTTASSVVNAAKNAVDGVINANGAVEEDADEMEQDGEDTTTVSETAALELASALSAVSALVDGLGAFLAPYLPVLLDVLLNPAVLHCQEARCASTAADIRAKLVTTIPVRLLLGPLFERFSTAAENGTEAACQLLDMVRQGLKQMKAADVAAYHEPVFAFVLKALDTRRAPPPAIVKTGSGGVERVEAATVGVLVELTLQLSETRFRPLFFRLIDWADTVPADLSADDVVTTPNPLARQTALFSVANALSEKLRSVFVPYFKALIDPALAALGHAAEASTAAPKKKQKKSAKSSATENAAEDDRWRLRLKTVRALHRCFLYDTVDFLDEARFTRLLDPLVAQLKDAPPPQCLPMLESDIAEESGLDGSLDPESKALDVYGRAVAACLAQMAVTAGGGDARWRPLNHAVLMASRSEDSRTRLLSLETVAALAGSLREEYLALLPEALPFLGELLEDVEGDVERRAAAVVKLLEELSGEDLGQYMRG